MRVALLQQKLQNVESQFSKLMCKHILMYFRSTPDLLFSTMGDEEDISLNESSLNGGEDRVTDLPPSSVLQHLGKARPKRPKKPAPSRGAVVASASASANNSNVNDSSIDDGVEAFYPASFNSSGFSSPSGSANRYATIFFSSFFKVF